ncbi:tRNA (N6-isopentenyl adenosine(37)-C2)-methylthiotransferase MiaB [Candidatus Dojkabacteria bacterium]|nr:tRNA (N6-isopentenyl adenosine(37)-C2)-methylthiotransferase MiaB [Candidatus Dojkabacteria bacterium]
MKFHIKTWGCQMNYSDTENIRGILLSLGLQESRQLDGCDIVVFNTCSVRQRAEDKVLGLGRIINEFKTKNPTAIVILTGCMSQRIFRDPGLQLKSAKYKKMLKRQAPWVDYFVDTQDLESLKSIVQNHFDIREKVGSCLDRDILRESKFSTISANVPITIGCDNFCTYCIVPYTRGKEMSLSFHDIYQKVEQLVFQGYKLITLLGQNVDSWQGEINGVKAKFADLLENLVKIDGSFWLTFLTSHPKDFESRIVDLMKDNEKLCSYINLPVQSGSSLILKKMNRGYSRDDYFRTIEYIHEKYPNVRLSTDVIVGFPGETEEDFNETFDLVKKSKFSMAYVSEYSPRPPAASATMNDDVPRLMKKERKRKLEDFIVSEFEKRNTRFVGKTVTVLVLSPRKAVSNDLTDVIVDNVNPDKIGTFQKVKIVEASKGGLVGEFLKQ